MAGLILLPILLGMLVGTSQKFLALFLAFIQIAPYLAMAAQALMVVGLALAATAPKQCGASKWAYAALSLGIGATLLTLATYHFQWPMQWVAAHWMSTPLQGILMSKFLAVFSRWIHETGQLDLVERTPSASEKHALSRWTELQDLFEGLTLSGLTYLVACAVFVGGLAWFVGYLARTVGIPFLLGLSVAGTLVGILWGCGLLAFFNRGISKMLRSFGESDSTLVDANRDGMWTAMPQERLNPIGMGLGILALAAIGADWYAKQVMAPKYTQQILAEMRSRNPGASANASSAIGKPAPVMNMQTIDGQPLSLAALKGKTVLLNFWATWCGPCVKEIPDLKQLAAEYEDKGVVVIGVSNEPIETLQRFVEQQAISYPIVSGRNWAAPFDKISAVPTTYLIDASGTIQNVFIGARTYEDFRDAILQAANLDQVSDHVAVVNLQARAETTFESTEAAVAADEQQ